MRGARLVLAALVALLAPGACGELPRPFIAGQKEANDLLHLDDRAGVVVRPLTGEAPGAPGPLAQAMAARLRALNVPASTGPGNRESAILGGRARVRPAGGGREEVLVRWELRRPGGGTIGSHGLRRVVPAGAWQAGRPALVEALAAEAAPAIAAMVQGPPVEMARIPGFPRARLVILPLDGAPGDSEVSLPRALAAELAAAELPVAQTIQDDDLLVLGDVALGPARNGVQEVAIEWRVIQARADAQLGVVAQRNWVAAGSLDGPWGQTAREIAREAAAGVIDLLERAAGS